MQQGRVFFGHALVRNTQELEERTAESGPLGDGLHQGSDDHDRIRSNVADLWLTSIKLGTHARQLHEGLSQTATSLQGTQTQLSKTAGVVDTTRENLEQMKSDLSHVKMNHEDLVMKRIDDEIIIVFVPEVMEEAIEVVPHKEVLHVHFIDEVVKMPVTLQKQVQVIQEGQRTVEIPPGAVY